MLNKASNSTDKARLRQEMRERLKSRDEAGSRAASETQISKWIHEKLLLYPGCWLSFRGFGFEPRLPTEVSGIRFAYPVISEVSESQNSMGFYRAGQETSASFQINHYGIEEPNVAVNEKGIWQEVFPEADAEVIGALVPGLAFSYAGERLGRGRGYYDRYLSFVDKERQKKSLKPLIKIGIGFSEQLVETVYSTEHDVQLDFILTDREWVFPINKGVRNG